MKKNLLILSLILFVVTIAINGQSTVTTEWELSVANSSLPEFLTTAGSGARSVACGTVGGEKILVLPSREPVNPSVTVLNASDGTTKGTLNLTGVSGGTVVVSDAAITDDGKILVSNIAVGTKPFKVYMWDAVTSAPTVAISYTVPSGSRLGDQITVTGKISDGSAVIYAADINKSMKIESGKNEILKFSMIEDPANPDSYIFNNTPEIFSSAIASSEGIPVGTPIANASIAPLPDGYFIYVGKQSDIIELSSSGSLTGNKISNTSTVASATYVDSKSNVMYVGVYNDTNQGAVIYKIQDNDWSTATVEVKTPKLGGAELINGNGTGRLVVEKDGTDTYLYVLGTARGIGKYKLTLDNVETGLLDKNIPNINYRINGDLLEITGVVPTSIEVYNVSGQLIKTALSSPAIELNDMKGVYVVRIKIENGNEKSIKILR